MVTPEAEPIAPKKEPCVHRWIIEILNPNESRGVCRNCDAVKIYPYWYEDALRSDLRKNSLTGKMRRKIGIMHRSSYVRNGNLDKQ